MNSPLILSYNDYSRANAEKKEKVKYGGSNLKVYIFLADGFEEIEGLTVVDIMRRAKIDVETISITGQKQINGAHKIIVEADRLFEETDFSDGDMLVLPGGMPGTLNLKEHEGLRNLIGEFDKKKKYLAAICAAPSILSELGIVGYRDILVSCDYHQTKYTGLYHTFMDLYPAESYLHIGDNAVADGFCAKSNGMDVYIIQSAIALLEKSSYGFMLKKQLSLNERSMLGLLIAKIFNSPFSLYGSDRRPYVDSIKDISYLYFAPVILKVMLWLMDKLLEGDYEKVLFSARDGFLIQELYDYMRLTRNGLPDSVYFQASRVLCARAGLSSDADIEWMLSAPFDCSWKEVVKERFDLNDNDMLDEYNSEYNSVLDYAMSHKDKIYKRSREIRQNYNKYMKLLGIKEGRTYAFYDFVSCGTCQYFLNNFVSFNLQGLYCGYYDSVTGGKRNVPIEALFVNQNYFQRETAFFKRYLLFERIMTSTASSVISMDTCGKPLFSEESRSLHELNMVKIAQESIKDYIKKYIDSLYVDGSSIDVMFVDALFALFSLKYTNENCEEFEQILLVDDFGKNILKITREELQ